MTVPHCTNLTKKKPGPVDGYAVVGAEKRKGGRDLFVSSRWVGWVGLARVKVEG